MNHVARRYQDEQVQQSLVVLRPTKRQDDLQYLLLVQLYQGLVLQSRLLMKLQIGRRQDHRWVIRNVQALPGLPTWV
jgi:hypothetical protein